MVVLIERTVGEELDKMHFVDFDRKRSTGKEQRFKEQRISASRNGNVDRFSQHGRVRPITDRIKAATSDNFRDVRLAGPDLNRTFHVSLYDLHVDIQWGSVMRGRR